MQALFQRGSGYAPAVEHSRFRRDYGLRLSEERSYELIAAEVGVYPCANGLYAVGDLFGEGYGFAQQARRHEDEEGRYQSEEYDIDRDDDETAVPAEAAAQGVRDAGSDEAHDIGDEEQSEHVPEKVQEGGEYHPYEINAVDAYEVGNTERHLSSLLVPAVPAGDSFLQLWANIEYHTTVSSRKKAHSTLRYER